MTSGDDAMNANAPHDANAPTAAAMPFGGDWLLFRLGDEEYGLDLITVREIRAWEAVTPLRNVPAYVLGVLNLRGTVMPVYDLRLRFGFPEARYDAFTSVIVVDFGGRPTGLVVDRVADVTHVEQAAIRAVPIPGGLGETGHIAGLATVAGRTAILFDTGKLINVLDLVNAGARVH
jgi:purine-binding chemotaxis protein CheW